MEKLNCAGNPSFKLSLLPFLSWSTKVSEGSCDTYMLKWPKKPHCTMMALTASIQVTANIGVCLMMWDWISCHAVENLPSIAKNYVRSSKQFQGEGFVICKSLEMFTAAKKILTSRLASAASEKNQWRPLTHQYYVHVQDTCKCCKYHTKRHCSMTLQ